MSFLSTKYLSFFSDVFPCLIGNIVYGPVYRLIICNIQHWLIGTVQMSRIKSMESKKKNGKKLIHKFKFTEG